MASVGICTPHGDKVSPRYFRNLLTMQGQFPQHQFVHIEVDTMIVGKARNMLVETALGVVPELDVLWWIDNDVLVPPDSGVLIDQVLGGGGIDIISGLYFNRRQPFTPQVFHCAEEDENLGKYWPIVDLPSGGIEEVDAAGFGCIAMRPQVFHTMKELWDARPVPQQSSDSLNKIIDDLSPWFEFLNRKGEDMYFCERAKEAGFKIWINYDIKCGHLGETEIQEYHFKYLVDNNLLQKVPSEGEMMP